MRQALLGGEIDLAVHSLKDLPVAPEPGLVVAAIPAREDPRDVLVARDGLTLGELPAGSVVGTGSPRRAAQLRGARPRPAGRGGPRQRRHPAAPGARRHLRRRRPGPGRPRPARPARRGQRVPRPAADAAGPRPGRARRRVPRRTAPTCVAAVAPLDDADTRACVTAERALLAALEAGCTAPVGALAEVVESERRRPRAVAAGVRRQPRRRHRPAPLRSSAPSTDAEASAASSPSVLLADGASEISSAIAQPTAAGRPPDPGRATGDDVPLAVPAAEQPTASSPDRPTPERAS